MNDHTRGIYLKYFVQRLREDDARRPLVLCRSNDTGAPYGDEVRPIDKHADCAYFVLDLKHDAFAGPALQAYARACEAEFPALAADLRAMFPPTLSASPSPATAEPTREGAPVESPKPRSCNRHDDCDAADARAKANHEANQTKPRQERTVTFPFSEHCHDDDCEDCFGR